VLLLLGLWACEVRPTTDAPVATEAPLRAPHRLLALPDGSLLIADACNNQVKRISKNRL
jgi:hypothetical protein